MKGTKGRPRRWKNKKENEENGIAKKYPPRVVLA